MSSHRRWGLGALVAGVGGVAVGIVTCWWQIRSLGDMRLRLPEFYGWFSAAFGLYLIAWWLVSRLERRAMTRRTVATTLVLIGGAAIVARVLMLGTIPTLSDDIHRYRWDGRVQHAGVDPYAYPPNDPTLAFLRDQDANAINFPYLRTVYPPLTELAFLAGTSFGGTLTIHKIVFVATELLTVFALLVILTARGSSPLWVVAYAWHPLAILEIAGSGHNDALGIALMWLGIAAWSRRRYTSAAASLALAFLSKYATAVLLPWWWFRRTARGSLGVFLLLSTLPLLLHPTTLSALAQSLTVMSTRFGSNGSIHDVLAAALGSSILARVICFGVWGVLTVFWARGEADPIRYVLMVMAAAALLSPVLHPWYLVWLVPAFCVWRVPALVALTGSVVLAYTVWPGYLATGVWMMPIWAHVLEYAIVGVVALWEVRRCAWRSSFRLATKPRLSVKS